MRNRGLRVWLKSVLIASVFAFVLSDGARDDYGFAIVPFCGLVFGTFVYLGQEAKRRIPKSFFLVSLIASATVLFLAVVLAMIIVFIFLGWLADKMVPKPEIPELAVFVTSNSFRTIVMVSFAGTILTTLVEQVSKKLGPGVLANWVLGRYYQPRWETRIFMFLDMKDSTAHAEQLGNLRFSKLVQDFFMDLSDPVDRCLAEVSHYIGDEAVISWKVKQGRQSNNCIRLFFEFQTQITKHEKRYRDRYGFVPQFKAALHM